MLCGQFTLVTRNEYTSLVENVSVYFVISFLILQNAHDSFVPPETMRFHSLLILSNPSFLYRTKTMRAAGNPILFPKTCSSSFSTSKKPPYTCFQVSRLDKFHASTSGVSRSVFQHRCAAMPTPRPLILPHICYLYPTTSSSSQSFQQATNSLPLSLLHIKTDSNS